MVGGVNLDVAHIVPDVVKSERNSNSSSKPWPIMVKHLNGFLGEQLSLSVSLANQFFFCVHTHDWIAWALIRLLELVNGLKLLIAMFSLFCCQCLHCFGFRKV
jgi:hypothetical protein